jgi:ferric-dicitrate binding protein FerR (iron transport regulator)
MNMTKSMIKNGNGNNGNSLSEYPYDDSLEARKVKAFVEDGIPEGINLSRIEQLTFQKIHQHKVRRRIIWSVAASLTIILVMSFSLLISQGSMSDDEFVARKVTTDYVSVKVPVGDKMTLLLSDGSKIVANSRSEVRYPKTFTGDIREVYACGEVYFDVAHDKDHPFIVNTNGVRIRVLGTKFCVTHHSNNKTEVVLIEGCVAAKTSNNDEVTMHPNQQLQVENGTFRSLQEVDAEDYISWMDGVLNLHGDDLQTVIVRINDYYGTNIPIEDIRSDMKLYGKLIYQKDVHDVLNSVNALAGTNFH